MYLICIEPTQPTTYNSNTASSQQLLRICVVKRDRCAGKVPGCPHSTPNPIIKQTTHQNILHYIDEDWCAKKPYV